MSTLDSKRYSKLPPPVLSEIGQDPQRPANKSKHYRNRKKRAWQEYLKTVPHREYYV